MIRYLLGDLSELEQSQLEQKYAGDDIFFEEMLDVENELIDSYVRGKLSPRDRELFERRFLVSPRQRRRVEFARALMQSVSQSRVSQAATPDTRYLKAGSWWESLVGFMRGQNLALGFSLAAALLMALGASWLWMQGSGLRDQIQQAQAERARMEQREQELQRQLAEQRARGAQLARELELAQSRRNLPEREPAMLERLRSSTLSLVVTPWLLRGSGDANRLVIRAGIEQVQLQVYLESKEHKTYRLNLRTVDGEEIWSRNGLQARSSNSGAAVIARVPASLFVKKDYLLTLSGATVAGDYENIGQYYVTVVKE